MSDETKTEQLDELTLAMPAAATSDETARTISGLVLPYETRAERTSAGRPVVFASGALVAPDDLARVKLLIDHETSAPVGYCTALTDTPNGVEATFKIATGSAGDQALAQAAEKLRDGLSVGVDPRQQHLSSDGQTLIISKAVLNEVSLCALPAFSDARVTSVKASQQRKEQPAMTNENTEKTCELATENAPAPAQAQPLAFTSARKLEPISAAACFDQVASMIQTGMSASQVTAALADVTTANDPAHSLLPAGELEKAWQARETERKYIDNCTTNNKPLTSGLEIRAWGWTAQRPSVDDYAGDKANIPSSGGVGTTLFTGKVYRVAGGNDVDRIYIDMADGSIIQELFTGYMEDYAAKSDDKIKNELLRSATALTTGDKAKPAGLPAALVALGLKMPKGSRIDYVAVSGDVWEQVAALDKNSVPWWLSSADGLNIGTSSGSINNVKFWVDSTLPAKTILAGDKRAMTYREKTPPVRVQAVDIARGGIDLAVFGYAANFVSEPRAIIKATLA